MLILLQSSLAQVLLKELKRPLPGQLLILRLPYGDPSSCRRENYPAILPMLCTSSCRLLSRLQWEQKSCQPLAL